LLRPGWPDRLRCLGVDADGHRRKPLKPQLGGNSR
jgi:hypothetical protein